MIDHHANEPETPATTDGCTQFRAVASAFVDGELEQDARRGAEQHLVMCGPCRTHIDRLELMDLELRAFTAALGRDAPLPKRVSDAVLNSTVWPQRRDWWLRVAGGAGWAAAAAIGVAWIFTAQVTRQLETIESSGGFGGSARLLASGDSDGSRDLTRVGDSPSLRNAAMFADGPDALTDIASCAGSGSTTDHAPRPVLVENRDDRASIGTTDPLAETRASEHSASLTTARSWRPGSAQSPADRPHRAGLAAAGAERRAGLSPLAPPLVSQSLGEWGVSVRKGTRTAEDRRISEHPTLQPADSDTVFAASLLLDRLARIDPANLEEVERLRYVIAYDQIIDRLADTRRRLDADDRPLVTGAECFLIRLVRGPVEEAVILQMQIDLERIRLYDKLEGLSDRIERRDTF